MSEEEVTYPVTKEELTTLREGLAKEFPDDHKNISDVYVESIASKPYSKDPTIRRPLEYSAEKLTDLMNWRKENATHLPELLSLAKGGESAPAAVEQPEKFAKAKAMAAAYNLGAIYWHGLDKQGRPILWVRTNRLPWFPDVESQINVIIHMADAGIKLMPEGVTDFVCIADSHSPPPPHPQFMLNVLSALMKGYPDRLYHLVSCPVGSIMQTIMNLCLPLMPTRLSSKILLISKEDAKKKMGDMLLNGEDDIPTFLDGTADHDQFYPDKGTANDGLLKFDYDGMIERLTDAVKKFESKEEE